MQLVVMEITRGKQSRVWCMIERIKEHHDNHKHKSSCLTPSWLLDFTCNPKHKLELDLWGFEKFRKEKL
jgi:hypothetical protein